MVSMVNSHNHIITNITPTGNKNILLINTYQISWTKSSLIKRSICNNKYIFRILCKNIVYKTTQNQLSAYKK